MDEDLLSMDREQLIDEIVRLRTAIRAHRDASCLRYRQSLDEQLPTAPRTSKSYPGESG